MAAAFGYSGNRKLKSRKLIGELFASGKSFSVYPIRISWLPENKHFPLQAGVGVSKRNFSKATDRNRIKRLLRECWRLQKNDLEQQLISSEKSLSLFINYSGKEMPTLDVLMVAVKKGIDKLETTFFKVTPDV